MSLAIAGLTAMCKAGAPTADGRMMRSLRASEKASDGSKRRVNAGPRKPRAIGLSRERIVAETLRFLRANPTEQLTIARAGGPVIHVARDDARLAAIRAALRFFAPDVPALSFPAWDCLPYDRISPGPEIAARRMATLAALAAGFSRPAAILTTVNAATQRVPARETLAASSFTAEHLPAVGLVLRPLQMVAVEREPVVADPCARAEHAEVGLHRDHHEVVARLAEDGALRLRHAHNRERPALHLDGCPNRVAARK